MKNIPSALSYDDVLLVPQHSLINSRSEVDLKTKLSPTITLKLPLISVNMSDVTETKMAIAIAKLGGLGFIHRFISIKSQANMIKKVKSKKLLVGAAIGCKDGYLNRAEALVKAGADAITIDVAHAAMQKCIEATKKLKQSYPKTTIISGVIATFSGADDLFKAGADCVRVGVGPGTICTTRTQTGVGVPQITAILNATRASKKHNKTILCDGGTKNSGDIMKGLAAGASAVVIGSQFAGTSEAPGKTIIKSGKRYKSYNASTSYTEKKSHLELLRNIKKNYINHVEGVESFVPFKGSISKIILKIQSNLKAGFSYCGAKNIGQLWENAEFVKVTNAGIRESGAHDVMLKS